jgi:uncharacterized membrane protein (UPF0127 family)
LTETALPDHRRPPAVAPRPVVKPHNVVASRSVGATRRLGTVAACVILSAAMALAGCGCKRDPAVLPPAAAATTGATGKPLAVVKLGNQPFNLEVAASDADRRLGLMYRKSMPADAGMVFVFAREEPLQFWMRNTQIPLDIVYLDAGGKVVSVKPLAPYDESGVPSDGPSKYAIELNQGTAARVGIKAGDVIALPPSVQNPPDLE